MQNVRTTVPDQAMPLTGGLHVPKFVTITDVTPEAGASEEYVIANEATGRYFLVNRSAAQFYFALRETGRADIACQRAGVSGDQASQLVQQMLDHGVLIRPGHTVAKPHSPQTPLESKAIFVRWDLVDASAITARLSALGRFLFSSFGYGAWVLSVVIMLLTLIVNREKAYLTLVQIFDASLQQWLMLAGVFVALKAVHEFGHALAYQEMCRQEGLSPGPIRMGLSIFAMSPFPFTDVTGAWRLRSRFRRVMIGAGGIYAETWVMVGLTLFWAHTQAGMLQTVILQVAIIGAAMALLFNLNPAVKLDGYFMLTDYLRKPNLSGRASLAARQVFARALGAPLQRPNGADLLYWCVSYGYRWVIFAGIFWIAFQFDPRLAPLVLVIVAMLLVIRPLWASFRFAQRSTIKPLRSFGLLLAASAFAGALFVPLPYWQTVPAQSVQFETRFIEPTEASRLSVAKGGRLHLRAPALDQQITDVRLQKERVANLQRARFASAEEQARLAEEITGLQDAEAALQRRRAAMVPNVAADAVWTPLESRFLDGAWVLPGQGTRLASVSTPTPVMLRLRLEQRWLDDDVPLDAGTRVSARPVHAPECLFFAQLTQSRSSLIAVDGVVSLEAVPAENAAACAKQVPHGAALRVRLDAPRRSVAQRLEQMIARMLQNRLPINNV